MTFNQQVYEYVKKVPKGRVVTYGQVAKAIGCPRCSRQVGWALHKNPEFGVIPCHRVIFADGSVCSGFAFGGKEAQIAMLKAEGIEISGDKIDLTVYRWEE